MIVHVLRTPEEQRNGVIPFIKPDGRLPCDVFFFPYVPLVMNVHPIVVTGQGLQHPIYVYALDHIFKKVNRAKYIQLCPTGSYTVPSEAAHIVETATTVPVLTDFNFLRGFLP